MKANERLIGNVVERSGSVYVYDERGTPLFTKPSGKVHGFTSRSVSILRDKTIYTYNNKGNPTGTRRVF
jgi:hypothetical protein